MWNILRKKKNQQVEPKLTRYEKKKNDAIKSAKEKFPKLEVSEFYVNATLSDFIFIDRKNKKIATYKTVSPFHTGASYEYCEQQTIPFINLEEVGICYGTKTILLWSDVDSFLMTKHKSVELMLNEFEEHTTMDLDIMLYVREKSEYYSTYPIEILMYDKQNKLFQFTKNVEDAKRMFALLAETFHLGEEEAFAKRKKDEYDAKMNAIEEQTKKIKANSSEDCEPFLTDLLSEWEYIVEHLLECSNYLVDFYNVSIELLGLEENTLYLGCKPEKVDYLNTPQIKSFINVFFFNRGFRSIEIISNEETLLRTMLESNNQGEQIFKEVSNMFDWTDYEAEGRYRTYKEGKLFINYGGKDLQETRAHCRYLEGHNILPSALRILTGNENIKIYIVNSSDSIEQIPINELERLWDTIKLNIISKFWILDEEKGAGFQSSKVTSFKDGTLSYYYPTGDRARAVSFLEYQLRHEIQYYFSMHTGLKDIDLKVIENPEIINEYLKVPVVIRHWITELKHRSVHLFKVFDMRDGVDYLMRDKYEYVVVFVDDQVYVQYFYYTEINDTPSISNLTKKHVHIYDSNFPKRIYIGELEFIYNEKFAKELQEYVIDLDFIQQNEKEKIRERMIAKEKLVELVEKFYSKEIKNRFRPKELDQIIDGDHSTENAIQKLAIFLMKKGYVTGKVFLISEVIREYVVELAVKDLSAIFLQQNKADFEQIDEMELKECLAVYHTLDFANVENNDHLFLFMSFLLQHEKISLGTSYFELTSNIRQLLYESGEEGELNEYEEYLLSDGNETEEYTINMVDRMDGYQFEAFVADLFHRMGYNSKITQSSGDYGIDVIAKKKGLSLGIQAKCYSSKVPNKAIQEAIAGIVYYRLNKGMVVTNSYFTKQAENQAASSNIELWDRDKLSERIQDLY